MLPKEIWLTIFEQLNKRDLLCMSFTCKLYNGYVVINKLDGFPRVTSQCKLYPFHLFDTLSNKKLSMNKTCHYMYDHNYDMVRGDIIYTNGTIYVYDGIKLIHCLYHHHYHVYDSIILPREFAINNSDVPIDYWYKVEDELKSFLHYKDIRDMARYIWIDYNYIKKNTIEKTLHNGNIKLIVQHGKSVFRLVSNEGYLNDCMVLVYQFNNFGKKKYYVHKYEEPEPQQSYCTIF